MADERRGRSDRSDKRAGDSKRSGSRAPRSGSQAPSGSKLPSNSKHPSGSKTPSASKAPPNSSKSAGVLSSSSKTRRPSTSSGERAMFHMSDDGRDDGRTSRSTNSSSASASRRESSRVRRPSNAGEGLGDLARRVGNMSVRDGSSGGSRADASSGSGSGNDSSDSWQPKAPVSKAPVSRLLAGGSSDSGSSSASLPAAHGAGGGGGSGGDSSDSPWLPATYGAGSGSGSGFFSSQASGQDIPSSSHVDPARRQIIVPSSRFPGSGHSDEYKPRAEASTAQSFDSWKDDAPPRKAWDAYKQREEDWQKKGDKYYQEMNNTPEDRLNPAATGRSYSPIGKKLNPDQHMRHGKTAHDTLKLISETANNRVEHSQREQKSMLKKGLMTGANSIRGHDQRVGILEGEEDVFQKLAQEHYARGPNPDLAGVPQADLERARQERQRLAQQPPNPRGAERDAYDYGARLAGDGRATQEQLTAAGWNQKYQYADTTASAAHRQGGSSSVSNPPSSSNVSNPPSSSSVTMPPSSSSVSMPPSSSRSGRLHRSSGSGSRERSRSTTGKGKGKERERERRQ